MPRKSTSKPRGRNHRLRAKQNKASGYGGLKRARTSGGSSRVTNRHNRVRCTPEYQSLAKGSRFNDLEPTEAQRQEWTKILATYARRLMAKRHPQFTIAVLARAVGLEERQTSTIAKEGRDPERDPADLLAQEILFAMAEGKIAGVLGIRHTPESKLVFELVERTDAKAVPEKNREEFGTLKDIFSLEYLAWRADQ
jgi:hypothetical protein